MKKIGFAVVASAIMMTSAFAQQPTSGPDKYTLEFSRDDVNTLGVAIQELPAKIANPLTQKIVPQITKQQEDFAKANEKKDEKPTAPPAPAKK